MEASESVAEGCHEVVAEQKVQVVHNTGNSDEERGIKVWYKQYDVTTPYVVTVCQYCIRNLQVMMFSETATHQHGHVAQPTIAFQNKCDIHDYFPSFSPNENQNTDSELIIPVKCSDDDNIVNDDDSDNTGIAALIIYVCDYICTITDALDLNGTTSPFSRLHLKESFEEPCKSTNKKLKCYVPYPTLPSNIPNHTLHYSTCAYSLVTVFLPVSYEIIKSGNPGIYAPKWHASHLICIMLDIFDLHCIIVQKAYTVTAVALLLNNGDTLSLAL